MRLRLLASLGVLLVAASLVGSARAEDDAFAKAQQQFKAGNYSGCTRALEPLVEQSPQNGQYHYLLGESLFALARYKEAALEFKAAMNVAPKETSYAGRAAESFLAAGCRDDAVAVCDRACQAGCDPVYTKLFNTIRNSCAAQAKVKIRTTSNVEEVSGGAHAGSH